MKTYGLISKLNPFRKKRSQFYASSSQSSNESILPQLDSSPTITPFQSLTRADEINAILESDNVLTLDERIQLKAEFRRCIVAAVAASDL